MKKKSIPKLKSEEEERNFWSSTDSTDYIDWEGAERVVLPQLSPTTIVQGVEKPAFGSKRLAFFSFWST